MRSQSKRTSRTTKPPISRKAATPSDARATVAAVERELVPRVAAACDALQLPDGGSADLRRMAERTLLAVSLVLTARMGLARDASQAR